ncbi:hypothetical protein QCD71_23595 [Sphingomonas sp. PsM26]|nr:hypothetical protein [Sphingomonas sp. PsM26]
MLDTAVHFRANALIVEAAKEMAGKRGMILAESMRYALRRETDCANLLQAAATLLEN